MARSTHERVVYRYEQDNYACAVVIVNNPAKYPCVLMQKWAWAVLSQAKLKKAA